MNDRSSVNLDLGKAALNKVAEAAIASKLKSARNLEVDINSRGTQVIQGEANSVKIAGEKIAIFKDIQVEQIDVSCHDISIDLSKAILGEISFDRPGNFTVQIILTSADCARLLDSEYVKLLLQTIPLKIKQQPANFYLKNTKCSLQDRGQISLIADLVLSSEQQTKIAGFQIDFQFYRAGAKIEFKSGKYLGNSGLDLDETVAIINNIRDLLYLRHFSNSDLSLDITSIEVEAERLILSGNALVERLPDSLTQSIKSVASEIKFE